MEADYILNYDVLSVARETDVYLMARIKAGPVQNDRPRSPLNLSVVLDRSGSMSGDKIAHVKQATQFLIQHLGANDTFSLVTYDDHVKVEVPPMPVVHKDAIKQAIQKITPGGSTNLSGGWLQGCQLVAERIQEGANSRVMLLTDGLANVGIIDNKRLAAMARSKREEGISTTTIGVGLGFNEDLLVQMASEGGGAFYFIDNPDRAPIIFSEELQHLLHVVGQNLIITLKLESSVTMVRQLNAYPSDQKEGSVTFRLSDLYADEIKTLMLQLHIPALETLGPVQVATLYFDYDELLEESAIHRRLELPIRVNVVPEDQQALPNPEVTRSALLLRAARTRDEAIQQADSGNFAAAQKLLRGMAEEIKTFGLDDKELQAEHNLLQDEAMDMEIGEDRYDSYTRKMGTAISYSKSFTGTSSVVNFALRNQMKTSRTAIERNGDVPTTIAWNQLLRALSDDKLTIGRARDNDIVLDEEPISRHHCELVRENNVWYLVDLKSTNFTFANGGRVIDRFRLSVGDVVTVGTTLFTFS
jgi:Ca-activated chloride channel family protein